MVLVDVSNPTPFADLPALMRVATTSRGGVASWSPNRFILGRGAEPMASDLTADQFMLVCLVAVAPHEGRPDVGGAYYTALKDAQSASVAFGVVLQLVTLFLFGLPDHGGLREVAGFVAYPSAFPPPPPTAAADPPAIHTPATPSPVATPEPAGGDELEQAAKRAKVDAGAGGAVAASTVASVAETPATPGRALTDANCMKQVRPPLVFTLHSATAAIAPPHPPRPRVVGVTLDTVPRSRSTLLQGGGQPRHLFSLKPICFSQEENVSQDSLLGTIEFVPGAAPKTFCTRTCGAQGRSPSSPRTQHPRFSLSSQRRPSLA